MGAVHYLPSVRRGLFCKPSCAKGAGSGFVAHEVNSSYLGCEEISKGDFAIIRLGGIVSDGDLACVRLGGRNLVSRVSYLKDGVRVRDERGRDLFAPYGLFEIVGLVVDVCTGTPDCSHRSHPIAREVEAKELSERLLLTDPREVHTLAWKTDHMGLVTNISPLWEGLTGQSSKDLREWGWMELIHPEDRDRGIHQFALALVKGRVHQDANHIRLNDGRFHRQIIVSVPLLSAEGRVVGYSGINQIDKEAAA
jgi:PAS domain S-box-containing protein